MMYDSPFETNTNFPYIGQNIVQKLESYYSLCFCVNENLYHRLYNDLTKCSDILDDMCKKWKSNPYTKPSNWQEKKAYQFLNYLKVILKDLYSSNRYKICMWNEIRGLLKTYEFLTLFLTLNLANLHYILVHVLTEKDPVSFTNLSFFDCAKQVADNPTTTGNFFNIMIKAFIKYVLRHRGSCPSLFGHYKAYYRTVEAQERVPQIVIY